MSTDDYADADRYDEDGDSIDAELEAQLAFNRATSVELHRLRVRKAAAEMLRAEQEPDAEPFDAGTLAEILARPAGPPMRAEGLIPSQASTLVVAQKKTGKTTLELNWARSQITGEDFLGRFPVRPITGIVTLLNYEVSGEMIARWADDAGVPPDRLYIVNLRGRRNPLNHAQDRQRLADNLRARGTESLIVDPFGRAYTGKSQDDNGEVGAFLVDLDLFTRAEVGATDLMLSAHAGWNGERTRGASALEDWADSIITLTRDAEDDQLRYLRAEGRDVLIEEDRLGFNPTTRLLTMTGTGSRRKAKGERKSADLAVFVVRAAAASPGSSGRQIEAAIRLMDDAPTFRNGEVSKAAKYAEEQGLLRIEVGGSGRTSKHYAIDPNGDSEPDNPNRSQPIPTDPGEHLLTAPTAPIGGAVAVSPVRDTATAETGITSDVTSLGGKCPDCHHFICSCERNAS